MKEWVDVGKVLTTHGLKGELKIHLQTEAQLEANTQLYIKGQEYTIQKIRPQKQHWIIKLYGLDQIEDSERLRDCSVSISRDLLLSHEYLISDLVGILATDQNNNPIGKVKSVDNLPSQPVLRIELSSNQESVLIPLVIPEFILKINTTEKVIVLSDDWQLFI